MTASFQNPPVEVSALHLPELEKVEFLGSGFTAKAYRLGEMVYKLSPTTTHENALSQARNLEAENELVQKFLGQHAVPTLFSVESVPEKVGYARVVQTQEYVPGNTLKKVQKTGSVNRDALEDLSICALTMYHKTGYIPDIAQLRHGFRILYTPNIVVHSETGLPALVDTTLGRFQGMRLTQKWFSRMIARTTERGFHYLREQHN